MASWLIITILLILFGLTVTCVALFFSVRMLMRSVELLRVKLEQITTRPPHSMSTRSDDVSG